MKFFLFFIALITVFSMRATAQSSCGEPAVRLIGNNANNAFPIHRGNNVIDLGNIFNPSRRLSTIEYIIVDKGGYNDTSNAVSNAILNVSNTPTINLSNLGGFSSCRDIAVVPISYNLQELRNLINTILTQGDSTTYMPCCASVNLNVIDLCAHLNMRGIRNGNDIQSISNLFPILGTLSNSQTFTIASVINGLNILSSALPPAGICTNNISGGICYSIDTTGQTYYSIYSNDILSFSTVDTVRVSYPMNQTLYSLPPFSRVAIQNNASTCNNAFSYKSLNTNLLEVASTSGEYIVHAPGIAKMQVCARFDPSVPCDTIVVLIDSVVSVNQTMKQHINAKVYPNPTENVFQFSMEVNNNFTPYTMRLVDMAGRTVWSKNYEFMAGTAQESISISDLPQGVYIFNISNQEGYWQEKIIKY